MSYDPENQYRCTIIRGKTKNAMDDLLPAYAHILGGICPCSKEEFPSLFNRELGRILPAATAKTLSNHRTEIAGKLFGMYYHDDNGVVHVSQRTQKLVRDNDQPAFFKDMCYKFQFPNGMDKVTKITRDIKNGINIRQCAYLLEVLLQADRRKIILTIEEAAYCVLNSLDVLRRSVIPEEVVEKIIQLRKDVSGRRRVPSGSRGMQHIRETFNYLELANLISMHQRNLILNNRERVALDFIAASWDKPLDFDIQQYNISDINSRQEMYLRWEQYYAQLVSSRSDIFNTTIRSLSVDLDQLKIKGYDVVEGIDTAAMGDEGEIYVFAFEKNRVNSFNPRLVQKVLLLSRTKGLGYDIQSVRADRTPQGEHAIYIEVKATKRVTAPDPGDQGWSDVINLTRNEWMAAEQHRKAYSVYRIYFTPKKVIMFVINDPVSKSENGILNAAPEKYRVDFTTKAGFFLEQENEKN